MACPSCGAPVMPGALFCRLCGTRLPAEQPLAGAPAPNAPSPTAIPPGSAMQPTVFGAPPGSVPPLAAPRTCTNCGSALPEGMAFCTVCGTPIPASQPAAQPPFAGPPPDASGYAAPNGPSAAGAPPAFAGVPAGQQAGAGSYAAPSLPPAMANVVAFPTDTPNRVVLVGLAVMIIGFFLPWIHVSVPSILGSSGANIDFSAITAGWPIWLLLIALLAVGGLVLCQGWIYRTYPRTPHWLLAVPLAAGAFMTAIGLYPLVIYYSLIGSLGALAGGIASNVVSLQFGVYLVTLGGIILIIGGFQKLMREFTAPTP
jgi:hypothetical protein